MFIRPEGKIDLTDPQKSILRQQAMAYAAGVRERVGVSLHEPIDIIKSWSVRVFLYFKLKN